MLTLVLALASGLPFPGGIPQIKDAANVFFEADAASGDVDGVILCRVDVAGGRSWDTFGAVDLAVTLSISGSSDQRFEMWGEEDRASSFVTAPAVKLKKGDKVTLLVEDRDVTGREHIARGQASYAGSGLAFDLHETQIACKTVPAARAAQRAAPLLTSAEKRLAPLKTAKPNLRDTDGGWPFLEQLGVEADVLGAQAWIGETAETKKTWAQKEQLKQSFASSLAAAAKAFPKTAAGSDRNVRVSLIAGGIKVEALADVYGILRLDTIGADGVITNAPLSDGMPVAGLKKGASTVVALPPMQNALLVRVGASGDMIPLKP